MLAIVIRFPLPILAILLASCAAASEQRADAIVEGLQDTSAFARAVARYRDQTGQWPSQPSDVGRETDELVRFKPREDGLIVLDKRSGDALLRIEEDGTFVLIPSRGH